MVHPPSGGADGRSGRSRRPGGGEHTVVDHHTLWPCHVLMAATVVRTTYALDADTVRRLEGLARLRRVPMTTLQPASTTPVEVRRPAARNAGYCMRWRLRSTWSAHRRAASSCG